MMEGGGHTKVLMLPIFRHYRLWHAWGEQVMAAAAEGAAKAQARSGAYSLRDWRLGRNLEEKAQLLSQHASRWVSGQEGGRGDCMSTVDSKDHV